MSILAEYLLGLEWSDVKCIGGRGGRGGRTVSISLALCVSVTRRGADRGQRDCDDMTPLDRAQQRRHMDCIKILQTYGLKRPPSALSVASQVSLAPTTAPLVDKHGHIPLRRPKRQFSLSGISVSSINRLPADGQAHSESPQEEQSLASGGIEEGQKDCGVSMYNTLTEVLPPTTDAPPTGEGAAQEHSSFTPQSREFYQVCSRVMYMLSANKASFLTPLLFPSNLPPISPPLPLPHSLPPTPSLPLPPSTQEPRTRQRRWLLLLCGSSGGITCCSGRSNVVVPTDSISS